ncbi:hypothetical protein AQUCO_03900059v1 [Aquilegia coerulea]|uniref:Uncharacterized protein n=1 Tax=Aquilegia coerulea TaxID=218851 RepID=A0A2G5CRP3_AQUCA|nr:hypothetical protein AQUCO_03900059v1 [Aquilegia coerulea]
MDVEKFIDDFDTLWFFTNIFSSPPPPAPPLTLTLPSLSSSTCSNNITQNLFESSTTSAIQVQDIDISLQQQQQQHVEMMSVLKSPSESVKKEKRSTTPKRRDKMFMQFNEFIEFSDIDFTFVAETELLLYGELTPMGPRLYHPYLFCKIMPSLNDGMAMKEHIKSWACAVANTVK